MNREQLSNLHNQLCDAAFTLLQQKNQDYADADSVFGNLDMPEAANLCSTEVGILIRMFDKMSRLSRGVKRELAVKDESFEDTLLDIINYAVLLAAKRRSRPEVIEDLPLEITPEGLRALEQADRLPDRPEPPLRPDPRRLRPSCCGR